MHESIKTGKVDPTSGSSRQAYVNNYKQSIINMSKAGLDILCYNFMPVVDWTRTDLEFEYYDGSNALKFDMDAFAAFDLFAMKRKDACLSYTQDQIERARIFWDKLGQEDKNKLVDTVIKVSGHNWLHICTQMYFKMKLNISLSSGPSWTYK